MTYLDSKTVWCIDKFFFLSACSFNSRQILRGTKRISEDQTHWFFGKRSPHIDHFLFLGCLLYARCLLLKQSSHFNWEQKLENSCNLWNVNRHTQNKQWSSKESKVFIYKVLKVRQKIKRWCLSRCVFTTIYNMFLIAIRPEHFQSTTQHGTSLGNIYKRLNRNQHRTKCMYIWHHLLDSTFEFFSLVLSSHCQQSFCKDLFLIAL